MGLKDFLTSGKKISTIIIFFIISIPAIFIAIGSIIDFTEAKYTKTYELMSLLLLGIIPLLYNLAIAYVDSCYLNRMSMYTESRKIIVGSLLLILSFENLIFYIITYLFFSIKLS